MCFSHWDTLLSDWKIFSILSSWKSLRAAALRTVITAELPWQIVETAHQRGRFRRFPSSLGRRFAL
jgi:hypothetical protein